MSYPATTLTFQKSKFYVVCTIPAELREHFGGRKQIKRSAGTADLATAKRLQHGISAEIYETFDNAKTLPGSTETSLVHLLRASGLSQEEAQAIASSTDLEDPESIADLMFRHREPGTMNGAPAPAFTEAKEALDRVREVSGSKTDGRRQSAVLVRYLDESTWGREKTRAAAKKAIEDFISSMGIFPSRRSPSVTPMTSPRSSPRTSR